MDTTSGATRDPEADVFDAALARKKEATAWIAFAFALLLAIAVAADGDQGLIAIAFCGVLFSLGVRFGISWSGE